MADFKGSQVENSLKDGTGDDIGGAEVDANPFAIADGLDGTTSLTWGDSGTIDFGGSYSKAAWGLSGVDFRVNASTFTDSGTSGSGTATNAVAWSWGRPTFAATNSSVTMTNAATMYIANAPAAGTNVTLTNAYALWVDAGAVRFDGILNLDGSIDADVTDVDIASSGDIDLTSTSNAADAIYLRTNAGTSETIKIHADQGTSVTEGASSVQLLSDAGGVELKSTANLAKSIKLIADGGTSETIYIQADQGTSESSIQLVSDAGGIDIDAAAGKNVDIAGGQINLTSSDDAASAIYLRANAGTSETIKIHADQGSGAGSITLVSDAGGIDVDAAGGVTIDSAGISLDASAASNFTTSSGALTITSAAAATWSTAAGALTVNGTTGINLREGGSDIITISNSRAVATANTASIDLDASGAITMNSSGGTLSIGNDNDDQVVNLATAGTRTLNVGINDGTDVTTIVSKGNITNTGTLTVGVNDAGHDVKFFGDTAGAYMLWDTSADGLGIGTAPDHPFHVAAEKDNNWVAQITNTEATDGRNYGLRVLGGSTSGDTAFQVADAFATSVVHLSVRGDGNVGIGTASPAFLLHVGKAASGSTQTAAKFANTSDTANSHMRVIMANGGSSGGDVFHQYSTGTPNWITGIDVTDSSYKVNYGAGVDPIFGTTGTDHLIITTGGNVGIGTATFTNMTQGLRIHGGASDNAHFNIANSDVSGNSGGSTWGFTPDADDTIFSFQKSDATKGGNLIRSYTDALNTTPCVNWQVYGQTQNTTKSTAGRSMYEFYFSEHDGAGSQAAVTDNANMLGVRNYNGSAAVTAFMVDENGEVHAVASPIDAFDAEDDVALVRAFDRNRTPSTIIKNKWDEYCNANEDDLIRLGVLGDTAKNGGLVNITQLQRLHNGALFQLYTQIMDMCEKLEDHVPQLRGQLLPEGA